MTTPRRPGLAQEGRAAIELAELLRDPVYQGRGVPRGDGRGVVVLPGLFGNDFYLMPLHGWLSRVGYRPIISTITLNAGCPQRTVERVEAHVAAQLASAAAPLAIIGHSRGGLLGWALARRLGPRVRTLVTLGSPVGAIQAAGRSGRFVMPARMPAAPGIAEAGVRARALLDPDCDFPACGCAYVTDIIGSLDPATRVVSIYSRDDAVVPPSASPVAGGVNIEVAGTHSGLVYNREVYRHLGRALAGLDLQPE